MWLVAPLGRGGCPCGVLGSELGRCVCVVHFSLRGVRGGRSVSVLKALFDAKRGGNERGEPIASEISIGRALA